MCCLPHRNIRTIFRKEDCYSGMTLPPTPVLGRSCYFTDSGPTGHTTTQKQATIWLSQARAKASGNGGLASYQATCCQRIIM